MAKLPPAPPTFAKNGLNSMANNYLATVQPSMWNNIPIPIVDAFEAVTTCIKKLAG